MVDGEAVITIDEWSYRNHTWTMPMPLELDYIMSHLYSKGELKISTCEARDGTTVTVSVRLLTTDYDYWLTETVQNTNSIVRATITKLLEEASDAQ